MFSIPSTRLASAASKVGARTLPALSRAASGVASSVQSLNRALKDEDPEIANIVELEKQRQRDSIVLIPSENFTSRAVFDTLGSVMQNKYSEGYPGARYYGGNEYIDAAESLCQKRALETFRLDPERWGVNVQPLSGAPANLYVYYGVVGPGGRIMGLDLPHGGHLSHGYQTDTKKISAISAYFEQMPYRCDERTGLVDYDALEKTSRLFRPKLIVAGGSAYARNWDYERLRKIADGCGAVLMVDMAHISGLVAASVLPDPFPHADVVTTTTHKSLRGPRGAMIFFRRGVKNLDKKGQPVLYDFQDRINASVFPGHQGGPHNHTITALAVALKQAQGEAFKEYGKQVLRNAKRMEEVFGKMGYTMTSGGTDTHLLLLDLRDKKIDGARVERILELAKIAANKNTVPGDKSALIPGGLRMGSPAMTSRGLMEDDFTQICEFVDRAIKVTVEFNSGVAGSKLKDFKEALGDGAQLSQLGGLRDEVVSFARKFPTVGWQ
ncbi:glycine hydroxymethyltransferase [Gonapodya prolifera JEL478]|uniref:Serine hydroxymethyltransferase n=1 Tax=Gonapodya prolifera (strain JEL478) TaxID=1344416 RepID=A0A139AXV3_GONPJ|nr:glycine hydroxymethyltransferase [Gonapodya prolifera JEL478]|eukprot:KXS21581.1 glycine hydroxymethyltransferase [Gonapodya prolifera JEL478]